MKDPGFRFKNTVNLAGFVARSTVNGPGCRVARYGAKAALIGISGLLLQKIR
jgi:hypothetical protein